MEHAPKSAHQTPAAKVSQPTQVGVLHTPAFQFKDNRSEASAQRNIQSLADESTIHHASVQLKTIIGNSENPVQRKNTTGMPDTLKSGVENLSGIDMSDVKVHYNSSQPAQLNAHAYAQGTNIHIAPGQEKHLPHEAWHVVQQKQGRVKATTQMKKGVAINDDKGLENEADVMGAKSLQMKNSNQNITFLDHQSTKTVQLTKDAVEMPGIQGFQYDNIIAWNGTEGVYNGVRFIIDQTIRFMMATLNPSTVRYNPNDVGNMTPEARYFMIMHELSHIHYQHPGNDHPDSLLNETQADDTALVNAMTFFPIQAPNSIIAISNFFLWMINLNMLGGGTHPLTRDRKLRVEQLYEAIMQQSMINIEIRSDFIPRDQMTEFLIAHAQILLIDAADVRTFRASNGEFSYIQGVGVVELRNYLQWLPIFNLRRDLIPGFRYTPTWNVRPVAVQNQVKETIAGAVR